MMTEAIWIAIIGLVQAVTLGFIAKISKDSSVTRKEVKNSHKTNLRDDLDSQHTELLAAVGRTKTGIDSLKSEVCSLKRDVGRLDDRDLTHIRHHDRLSGKLDDLGNSVGALDSKFDGHLLQSVKSVARIAALEKLFKNKEK